MRWQRRGRSRNLEDRRARSRRRGGGLGIPMRIPMPRGRGGRLGLGSIVVLGLVMWLLGIDPMVLLSGGLGGSLDSGSVRIDPGDLMERQAPDVGADAGLRTTPQEEELVDFVSFVLDDVQETWLKLMPGYSEAKLVLFRGATRSGCGVGQSQMGPFYCPTDQKVYVDLAFYGDLRARFGAPGDFAQAYVLAHEIGHHVQRLSGIEGQVRAEQRSNPSRANELSVRMELQADCLAGVWGHAAARRDVLEPGDVEEGLRAAAAIGDDRIQQMSGRGTHPESWTHGSSAQRQQWLGRGLERGDPEACNTFGS